MKMKIISHNIEGFSPNKAQLLADLQADILCLQETHRENNQPWIPGMHLAIDTPSRVYGSAIFVKDQSIVRSTAKHQAGSLEILQIETKDLNIISVYKPPNEPFHWPPNLNLQGSINLIIGDFNSHSTIWGYETDDDNGVEVVSWALNNNLEVLYDPKDPPTFSSARWRRGYNPDLAFITSARSNLFTRSVLQPIPKSQHRPVQIESQPVIQPIVSKYLPRFNLKKADWTRFSETIDQQIDTIPAEPNQYDQFVELIWKAGQKNIPRGCRNKYIPGLTDEVKEIYEEYTSLYNEDPFDQATIATGELVLSTLSHVRQDQWHTLMENTDMTHNSKKAWATIRKLNSENKPPQRLAAVTPNQVAHQLIVNGRPRNKERRQKKTQQQQMEEALLNGTDTFPPFTLEELAKEIKQLKSDKAAGIDGIPNEFIKNLGPKAQQWLLCLFNSCLRTQKIPAKWRRSKVVALLKPNKDPNNPKSYRPISLLCTLYKLYERLLLNRIATTVDSLLTPDQAGFRPGRSCCGQVLNLTQYIEDGFELRQITGAVFVDLTAAYDTVNHRGLLLKLSTMLKNRVLVNIIRSLLENRRFYVEMNGIRSRWRTQRNGLPQGSVLAPLLFNIYTNDQPSAPDVRRFIYADDLCLATQAPTFHEVESRLTSNLELIKQYYDTWSLNPNPSKTQVCSFHLKNREANRKLKVQWCGEDLEHHQNPVYLGVTLDRTLSFASHVQKLRGKISSRNSLLKKLVGSKWGANAPTLRTSALALCYAPAEYCAPVWSRSAHAHKIDPMLNEACRTITGTLRPTPTNTIYRLAGIAPPDIRRRTADKIEKQKQLSDTRHPLHPHVPVPSRLKSRRSFATVEELPPGTSPQKYRVDKWKESDTRALNPAVPEPREELPDGAQLPRREWSALNRARARVARTGDNMVKWGLKTCPSCECGEPIQTINHVISSCPLSPNLGNADLININQITMEWLTVWSDKL